LATAIELYIDTHPEIETDNAASLYGATFIAVIALYMRTRIIMVRLQKEYLDHDLIILQLLVQIYLV